MFGYNFFEKENITSSEKCIMIYAIHKMLDQKYGAKIF